MNKKCIPLSVEILVEEKKNKTSNKMILEGINMNFCYKLNFAILPIYNKVEQEWPSRLT